VNKKVGLSLLLLVLFSCKTERKYYGKWVAFEEPFYGMSMEIKTNGKILLLNIPVILSNVLTDLEGNIFSMPDKPVFDAIQKEGYFNKQALSINLQNNGSTEEYQIVFSDGRTLELLLENGCRIIFKRVKFEFWLFNWERRGAWHPCGGKMISTFALKGGILNSCGTNKNT
jgi:hypothetical protein